MSENTINDTARSTLFWQRFNGILSILGLILSALAILL
jgi:hypothetical protein